MKPKRDVVDLARDKVGSERGAFIAVQASVAVGVVLRLDFSRAAGESLPCQPALSVVQVAVTVGIETLHDLVRPSKRFAATSAAGRSIVSAFIAFGAHRFTFSCVKPAVAVGVVLLAQFGSFAFQLGGYAVVVSSRAIRC